MRALALSLLIFGASSAQAFYIGPVYGFRSDFTESSPDTGDGNRSNSHIGVLFWMGLDILSLRTGIISTERTSNFKDTVGGREIKGRQEVSYLDIPLNIQIDLPAIPVYFFGGVLVGIKQGDRCISTTEGMDCDSKLRNHNNVLNVGLGYDLIDLTAFRLAVEGQYEHGLTNLKNSETDTVYSRAYVLQAVAKVGF